MGVFYAFKEFFNAHSGVDNDGDGADFEEGEDDGDELGAWHEHDEGLCAFFDSSV